MKGKGDYMNTKVNTIEEAVRIFLTMGDNDSIIMDPHLLNPFLRSIEPMKKTCTIKLWYDNFVAPNYNINK